MQTDSHDYSRDEGMPPSTDEDRVESVAPIIVNAHGAHGDRLDRFLAHAMPQYSRSRLQKWIAIGAVRSDDRLLSAKTRLGGHERIEVFPQAHEAEQAFVAEALEISPVHTDRAIFVIDKPAGLVVHPAAGNWRGTLLNGLLYLDARLGELPRAGIVHRLDKDTSGLMVVARTEASRISLIDQLSQRSMSRRYLAIVCGRTPQTGTVDAPIGRDPTNRLRMAVADSTRGKPARTDFRTLARGLFGDRVLSLVECRLHSGRTHQIRVHMKSIGYPLAGDSLYGGPFEAALMPRQMLHAWRLGLHHPQGGAAASWRSGPPADFVALADAAGLSLPELDALEATWPIDAYD